jgi:hypothetical protein
MTTTRRRVLMLGAIRVGENLSQSAGISGQDVEDFLTRRLEFRRSFRDNRRDAKWAGLPRSGFGKAYQSKEGFLRRRPSGADIRLANH